MEIKRDSYLEQLISYRFGNIKKREDKKNSAYDRILLSDL